MDSHELNIIDNGNHRRIQTDAAEIGEFLGVPVTDNS